MRSFALTGYSTLLLSDVSEARMPDAMTLFSVMFQLFAGLGVVAGTLALRLGTPLSDAMAWGGGPLSAFRIAFVLLAVTAAGAWVTALRLAPKAGAALLPARSRQPEQAAVAETT
jgi:hypothetical protein